MIVRRSVPFVLVLVAAGCSKRVLPPEASQSLVNTDAIYPRTVVALDGSASTDPNGLPLEFEWEFTAVPPGAVVDFNDPTLAKPSFTPDVSGDYEVVLTVGTGILTASTDPLVIPVSECTAPSITAVSATPTDPSPGVDVALAADVVVEESPCLPTGELTWEWSNTSKPAGSWAALNDGTIENPSFTPDVPGTYAFALTVWDELGRSSGPSSVEVTVGECGIAAPAIDAIDVLVDGAAAVPNTGDTVQLDATVTDADVDGPCGLTQPVTYAWEFADKPVGSRAELSADSVAHPWFVPDLPGKYAVRLVVTDSTGRSSASSTVEIDVDVCGSAAPIVESITPPNATASPGEAVQLGAVVTDADDAACGTTATFDYWWSLVAAPAGSMAALNDATLENPTLVPDVSGTYVLELVVVDETGRMSDAYATTITVDTCGEAFPSVVISDPGAADVGDEVVLGGTVTDTDNDTNACDLGQTFVWSWSVVSQPTGSTARLNNPMSTNPTLVPDRAGSYRLQLRVQDDLGLWSDPAFFDLVVGPCGTRPPVVQIGDPAGAPFDMADTITLGATVTDADDACGENPARWWSWRLVSAPVGSTATLSNPTTETPALVPDWPGDYVVALEVTDARGMVGRATKTIAGVGACGFNAPAVTDIAPNAPNTLQWTELTAVVTDPDNGGPCGSFGQTFTYAWDVLDQPLGATAMIDDATAVSPGFMADMPGNYRIGVTVWDSTGIDTMYAETLAVAACGSSAPAASLEMLAPFTASAGTSVSSPSPVPVGTGVRLSAMSTTDADATICTPPRNDPRTYQWVVTQRPAGSTAPLVGDRLVEATFTPDQPGAYRIEVWASDGVHWSPTSAAFTMTAAASTRVASPIAGSSVAEVAGGSNVGFDRPKGVVQVGTDIYVVNEGNDSVLRIDTANGNRVTPLSVGGFLNAPRHITHDTGSGFLYVLNGGDDFGIRIDRSNGNQVLYVDDTPLAEDIDAVTIGATSYVCVIGRFGVPPRVDCYNTSSPPGTTPVAGAPSTNFGGALGQGFVVDVAVDSLPTAEVFAQSIESGGTVLNLRHLDAAPATGDTYLTNTWEAGQLVDLSYDGTDDFLYYAVAGGNYVARLANSGGNNPARSILATSFAEVGGVHAASDTQILVTDAAANAVYRITIP